ncbi:MAG: DNA end-binding protein Ku [Chloroflexi bacterium]|jgi:DNA end-binding protein Ku|nr:MAG: DNA end-binding protein Ku [Chloroflexota bacterium]
MARRALWRGAISFGLVVIPIKLYTGTESKDLAFTTLHDECKTRLRQKRYCPFHEVDVEPNEIVRAYEYSKDQYVIMDEADFDGVAVPSTHTIDIVRFVDLASIDPIYFERTYALEPDNVGAKPFYLLKKALESTNRVAVAKVSLRQKEHICCIRPYQDGLLMETMFYPDEIRGTAELTLPEEQVAFTEQEVGMAVMLIDQLAGVFEPEVFHDGYRDELMHIIEAKLGMAEPIVAAPAAPKGKVGDLMEALMASIEATKQQRAAAEGDEQKGTTSKAEVQEEAASKAPF